MSGLNRGTSDAGYELFAGNPIFARLGEEQIQGLFSITQEIHLEKEEYLIRGLYLGWLYSRTHNMIGVWLAHWLLGTWSLSVVGL